jgi:hypothetical protein
MHQCKVSVVVAATVAVGLMLLSLLLLLLLPPGACHASCRWLRCWWQRCSSLPLPT